MNNYYDFHKQLSDYIKLKIVEETVIKYINKNKTFDRRSLSKDLNKLILNFYSTKGQNYTLTTLSKYLKEIMNHSHMKKANSIEFSSSQKYTKNI